MRNYATLKALKTMYREEKRQRAMAMMNKLEMEIGTIKSMKNEMKKELDREIRNRSTESQRKHWNDKCYYYKLIYKELIRI